MGTLSFLSSWQFILSFYLGIALLIYYNRDKFDIQGKIIAMYKTDIGLGLMDKIAAKHKKLVQRLGHVGIYLGYIGMALIVYMIGVGLWNLFFKPEAPAMMAPVIPGVSIPGSPIFVPFWLGMIALSLVVIIHEFSHGVVARAHDVKVKSSGFVMMGPVPGAFVEPDEEQLEKKKPAVRNAVFAAGPFSNILVGIIALLIISFVLLPSAASFTEEIDGVMVYSIDGTPADTAGIPSGDFYKLHYNAITSLPVAKEGGGGMKVESVNGVKVGNITSLMENLNNISANETVVLSSASERYEVTTDENGRIGINIAYLRMKGSALWFTILNGILELFHWIELLMIGIGAANLLPIGPVDGGRMFLIACRKFFEKKKAEVIWQKTSLITLLAVILVLVVPIMRDLLL